MVAQARGYLEGLGIFALERSDYSSAKGPLPAEVNYWKNAFSRRVVASLCHSPPLCALRCSSTALGFLDLRPSMHVRGRVDTE